MTARTPAVCARDATGSFPGHELSYALAVGDICLTPRSCSEKIRVLVDIGSYANSYRAFAQCQKLVDGHSLTPPESCEKLHIVILPELGLVAIRKQLSKRSESGPGTLRSG